MTKAKGTPAQGAPVTPAETPTADGTTGSERGPEAGAVVVGSASQLLIDEANARAEAAEGELAEARDAIAALEAERDELQGKLLAVDRSLRAKGIAPLTSMRLINNAPPQSDDERPPMEAWRNPTSAPVRLTLHRPGTGQEVPVTVAPGDEVELPVVWHRAVRSLAPQLVPVEAPEETE